MTSFPVKEFRTRIFFARRSSLFWPFRPFFRLCVSLSKTEHCRLVGLYIVRTCVILGKVFIVKKIGWRHMCQTCKIVDGFVAISSGSLFDSSSELPTSQRFGFCFSLLDIAWSRLSPMIFVSVLSFCDSIL